MLVHTYYKIPIGWQLLRGLLFILSVSFLICASTNVYPQTPLFQTGHELNSAKDATKKTLIGQQLWFVPNPAAGIIRIGFAKSTKHKDLMVREKLYPTDTVKIQVVEKVPSSASTGFRKFYRVVFDNGSSAFIETVWIEANLSKYTSNTITEDNLSYARSDLIDTHNLGSLFSEKFFKDDPMRMKRKIVELDSIIENRRKKIQERGGVLVGMTKAQVLSSSWGKPIEVNTTVVKGLVSEQWIYPGHNYLYFDNDRLTAIQMKIDAK